MAWRDDVVEGLTSLGGIAHLDYIYEAVSRVRLKAHLPLPPSWQAIIRRELEYNSTDSESYQGRHDLFYSVNGLGSGVWGLRALVINTPIALDKAEPPDRLRTITYRILRDTTLARQIKRLHKDRCQLCGSVTELQLGQTYSEAHHLQPLGQPHSGPDIAGNIVVLCPTCHVRCDYFAFPLAISLLTTVVGHSVEERFITYHNRLHIEGHALEPRFDNPVRS